MQDLLTKWLAWLERPYFGNALSTWILATLLAVGSLLVLRGVVRGVARRLGARESKALQLVGEFLGRTSFLVFLLAGLSAGSMVLALPPRLDALLRSLAVVAILIQAGLWTTLLLDRWIGWKVASDREKGKSTAVTLLSFAGKLVLWSLVGLLALENLGIDVTALIAGLGVGGIAIALATQNLLSDLLGSVAIALDKPFEIGDLIIVEDLSGTVEHIGLKTTRVRSIHGEQIVFSNADLLASRIRNYKRMSERRVELSLTLAADVALDKVDALPAMIRDEIVGIPDLRFERACFRKFGDYGLIWDVVFHVTRPELDLYQDRLHQVNLAILKRARKEGVELCPPPLRTA